MKLYTKTICPKCVGVKMAIEEHSAAVEIINIDHNEAAKQTFKEQNITTVPVLEANGSFITDLKAIHEHIAAGTK